MNLKHHAASRLVLCGIAGAAALISPEIQAKTYVSVGVGLSVGSCWPSPRHVVHCPPPVVYCPPPVVHCPPVYRQHYTSYSSHREYVYVESAPTVIYTSPAPVVYTMPAPVIYTTPAPVIYAPPAPVYQVVSQPAPAPAPAQVSAPAYRAIWVGPVEYEIRDGQFFRRTYEGAVWTEPPYGAVTRMLPTGYKSVWFKDVEFFECDKTYYRKTPEGYKVVPAPWI